VNDPNDPFEAIRRESNPLRRAKLAGELITLYQQRGIELARLRKEAINQAASLPGMNFSTVAKELGLTRGRITQIRQTAPAAERGFFGVGPITVAVPLRAMPGRALPMISSEDTRAADRLRQLLVDMAFQVESYHIPPGGDWEPSGDVVAICGPKSSPVTASAIDSDPFLSFEPDAAGKWTIRDRGTGLALESPMDITPGALSSDIAYVGRLTHRARTLFVIAGVHALGSVGAVEYLANNLPDLYAEVGTKRFSMVVSSDFDGGTVIRSELVCPPQVHE
jgi:hypothetical protein